MALLQLLNPEVYKVLVDPSYVPKSVDQPDGEIWYPATEEEFAQMVAEWEGDL